MKIIIEEYNPDWPNQFNNEKKLLEKILSNQKYSIEHIGSTAILDLGAKL